MSPHFSKLSFLTVYEVENKKINQSQSNSHIHNPRPNKSIQQGSHNHTHVVKTQVSWRVQASKDRIRLFTQHLNKCADDQIPTPNFDLLILLEIQKKLIHLLNYIHDRTIKLPWLLHKECLLEHSRQALQMG